jgi:hypothetical protein
MGGWGPVKLAEYLSASPFNKELSNETTFSLIHLAETVPLKVSKREIFDCSDFPDFYTIKSSLVGDLLATILTYYFNF